MSCQMKSYVFFWSQLKEKDSVWTTADTLLWLVCVSIWSGEGEQGIEGLEQILVLLDHCNKLAGLVILEM